MPQVHGGVVQQMEEGGYSANGIGLGMKSTSPPKSWFQFCWLLALGVNNGGINILFRLDNMSVIDALKFRTSRDPGIMHLLRCLYFWCTLHNITITATHIPGLANSLGDSLSRSNFDLFFACSP